MEWIAVESDLSDNRKHFVYQYNSDGSENLFSSIDQSKLESFSLMDGEKCLVSVYPRTGRIYLQPDNPIHLSPGRLIYFRRNKMVMTLNGPTSDVETVHVIGLQTNNVETGSNVKLMFGFDSTGKISYVNE